MDKSWINPKIEIRNSLIGGKGMFVLESIKKGEPILTWAGYTNKEDAVQAKTEGKLVLQWDDDLFSIEERGEDDGYFINHSCDSNTWMKDAHTLIAKSDIALGEEVTADYGLWEADESYRSAWNCDCKTSVCRHQITGNDWKLPEVQARYKDHFSPLLNKRILSSLGSEYPHYADV